MAWSTDVQASSCRSSFSNKEADQSVAPTHASDSSVDICYSLHRWIEMRTTHEPWSALRLGPDYNALEAVINTCDKVFEERKTKLRAKL